MDDENERRYLAAQIMKNGQNVHYSDMAHLWNEVEKESAELIAKHDLAVSKAARIEELKWVVEHLQPEPYDKNEILKRLAALEGEKGEDSANIAGANG